MCRYQDYRTETHGYEYINHEGGFVEYLIAGRECVVSEIYVVPGYRGSGLAFLMMDQLRDVAASKGCRMMTCDTDLAQRDPETAIIATLKYGFRIQAAGPDRISYYMEI